jgi:hypothetical protein
LSQRALVQLVSRLRGCLSTLTSREKETLILRSGLGLRRFYTASQVARILRVSPQREGQIERAAVARLQNAAAHTGCATSAEAASVLALLVPRVPLAIIQALLSPTNGSAAIAAVQAGSGA